MTARSLLTKAAVACFELFGWSLFLGVCVMFWVVTP